jgi:GcrA cell cycle regulator
MNGGTELPAPFIVESALEESAPAPVEATASACANGDAKPELPPVSSPLEPPSELSTNLAESAPEPSAILADPVTTVSSELSLGEKVIALTATACRWPCGDPQHSDFHFCGGATTIPPYCEHHRRAAYMALPSHPAPRRRRRLYTSARGIAWAG